MGTSHDLVERLLLEVNSMDPYLSALLEEAAQEIKMLREHLADKRG